MHGRNVSLAPRQYVTLGFEQVIDEVCPGEPRGAGDEWPPDALRHQRLC
jgi:hypothetical protein